MANLAAIAIIIGVCAVVLIILLGSTLGPSFYKIDQNSVGIYYDRTHGTMSGVNGPGRYFGSPEGTLFEYETTQQAIEFSTSSPLKCYTKESIVVTMSIRFQYTYNINEIPEIFDQFGINTNSSNPLREYITSRSRATLRHTCSKFLAIDFSAKRMNVANALTSDLRDIFAKIGLPVTFNNLQLNNFEYDPAYKKVIEEKVTAQSNSIQAQAERENLLRTANIDLDRALQTRNVELAKANGKAQTIINNAQARSDAIQNVWITQANECSAMMSTLGISGPTYIETLMKRAYLQKLGKFTIVE